jgi:hypothetical protein
MKKQELVHLHGLLAEVAGYCEQAGVELELDRYRSTDTHPMAINHSKGAHEEAVLALTRGLADSIGESTDATVKASAD